MLASLALLWDWSVPFLPSLVSEHYSSSKREAGSQAGGLARHGRSWHGHLGLPRYLGRHVASKWWCVLLSE